MGRIEWAESQWAESQWAQCKWAESQWAQLHWAESSGPNLSGLNCTGPKFIVTTRRARPFLNKASLLSIYHSLMRTHIDYCCTTWAAWKPRGNKLILKRLQAVCNKFFRLIYGLDRTASVRNILRNDNILNVYQTYDFHLAQMMHKARNSSLPNSIQNMFNIGIYRPCLYSVKPVRLIQSERSVSQAAPRVWNAIPSEITQEPSFTKFKSEVKKHILTKNFLV